eukprot:51405_1
MMGFFHILLDDDLVCPFNDDNNEGNSGGDDDNDNDNDDDNDDVDEFHGGGKQVSDFDKGYGSTATLITIAVCVLICGLVVAFAGVCCKKHQKQKIYVPTKTDEDDDDDGSVVRKEGAIEISEINSETDNLCKM